MDRPSKDQVIPIATNSGSSAGFVHKVPMRNIKLFRFLLMVLVMLGIPDRKAIADLVPSSDTIKVLVVKNFPPHYSLDANGEPKGFAIDIIKAVAKLANLKIVYIVKNNWTLTANALRRGEGDLIPNLGITKARREFFDFSIPIETFPISIITRVETQKINSVQDLPGKVVGVVNYNVGAKIMSTKKGVKLILYQQPEEALLNLLAGQVDALVYPKSVMLKIARASGLRGRIKIAPSPVKELKRAIAVRAGNKLLLARLNSAIQLFVKSRRYQNIYAKWYGRPLPYWTPLTVLIYAITMLVLVIIVFGVWRYKTLKKNNDKLMRTINDRKIAERALSKSEERFRTIFEQAAIGVALIDTNTGQYLKVNNCFAHMFGYSLIEMQDSQTFKSIMQPAELNEYLNELTLLTSGEVTQFSLEDRYQHQNGSTVWVSVTVSSTSNVEEKEFHIMMVEDITVRKLAEETLAESEQRFKELADNIQDVFWIADVTDSRLTKVVYVNSAFERLWQRSVDDIYQDNTVWSNCIQDADKGRVEKEFKLYLEGKRDLDIEFRIIRPDKSVCDLLCKGHSVKNGKGEIIRVVGVCTDITERKITEEVLRRTQKMDALGKLTGGIAHDYNNMLGVIIGYAQLLKNKMDSDPKSGEYLANILHAAERSQELTSKLLGFSRHKPGDQDFVNLNRVLKKQQHMLQKTLTARVELNLDLSNPIWLILVDEGELEDAIINLVINASHAIDGNGKLHISTSNEFIDASQASAYNIPVGDYVLLTIADTGEGIKEEIVDKIFDPFYSTKGEEGTGMGLSQVYGLMKRANGSVSVMSTAGVGAKFSLLFPRLDSDEQSSSKEIKKFKLDNETGNETILVVDDEPSQLAMVCEILESRGYTPLKAANAEIALRLLEKTQIDALFCDVIMPGLNGFELADRVSNLYPEVKIQLTSGYNEAIGSKYIDSELHQRCLRKPYSPDELLYHIRTLLDEPAAIY